MFISTKMYMRHFSAEIWEVCVGRKKTNTLILICDHTKGLYDDMWHGDTLHYTGMGKVGDQVLIGNQNKTLYESGHNGIHVHLFEVLDFAEYTSKAFLACKGIALLRAERKMFYLKARNGEKIKKCRETY